MLSREGKLVALIFSVLLFSILRYVIDGSIEAFPQVLRLIVYASLPVAGGLITLSFCSLLGIFSDVENSVNSHLLSGISENSPRNFSVGFLVTAYLNLVRPPLATNVTFLPYVEWVAIAIAVYVMYTMASPSTKEFYVGSEVPSWGEHTQKISREIGSDLPRLTSVMEQFVENNVKEPLLVYLALHLQRIGETEEGILKILSPLVDYQEDAQRHKLHFLVLPWARRKLALRNMSAREDLLKILVKKINRV